MPPFTPIYFFYFMFLKIKILLSVSVLVNNSYTVNIRFGTSNPSLLTELRKSEILDYGILFRTLHGNFVNQLFQ